MRRVRYLSLDEVLLILEELRRAYPRDLIRVMNRGVIESSLYAVKYSGRGYRSFRARVSAKAGSLLYFIVSGHPLTDGNKRFASLLVRYFLLINGYDIDRALLTDLSLRIAEGRVSPEILYRVLYQHIIRVRE